MHFRYELWRFAYYSTKPLNFGVVIYVVDFSQCFWNNWIKENGVVELIFISLENTFVYLIFILSKKMSYNFFSYWPSIMSVTMRYSTKTRIVEIYVVQIHWEVCVSVHVSICSTKFIHIFTVLSHVVFEWY